MQCASDEAEEQDDIVIGYRPTYKHQDDPDCLCVVKLLNSYKYTVLNFVMFHEKLRHAICQVVSVDGPVMIIIWECNDTRRGRAVAYFIVNRV